MNKLIVLIILVSMSGCATIERFRYGETSEERDARIAESDRRKDAALRIGTTEDDFVAAFGQPLLLEETETSKIGHYRINSKPMLVTFKEGKLTSYTLDGNQLRIDEGRRTTKTVCSDSGFGNVVCTTK